MTYHTHIQKNLRKMELEKFMASKLERAGFTHLDIIKTPLVTRIVLHVTKPGLAIGKGGQTIKQLTELITKDYAIDNPQIEIQEIHNPTLNAKSTVDKMANLIQREFPWRSVAFRTVRDIMAAGAQGVELTVKGKIAGKAGRKRKQRIAFGYMKKVGDQTKYVDYAKASAYPKVGAIGIKLRIIHPETVFPDKVDVNKVIESMKAPVEEKPLGKVNEEKIEAKKIENKEELTEVEKKKLHKVVEKQISNDSKEKKKVLKEETTKHKKEVKEQKEAKKDLTEKKEDKK
jgi:small subunit ribosomal protein S3